MYKVYIETGLDCSGDHIEYTGNRYATYDEAKPELSEARENYWVKFAWIEEVVD